MDFLGRGVFACAWEDGCDPDCARYGDDAEEIFGRGHKSRGVFLRLGFGGRSSEGSCVM